MEKDTEIFSFVRHMICLMFEFMVISLLMEKKKEKEVLV